jgi:hypothetical protein
MRHASLLTLALASALVLLGSGCGKGGGNQADINGEVRLDGRLVEQGSITFVPGENVTGKVAGGPIQQGRYRLAGTGAATIGWNRVEIRVPQKTGKPARSTGSPLERGMVESVEAAAPRFNTESTLTFEVKPGENTANFEVTSR